MRMTESASEYTEIPEEERYNTFQFLLVGDICTKPSPTNWIIKDYLDKSLACLFGEPGVMKSFTALDIGLCAAAGRDWHGIPLRATGPVFFIAGEGQSGLKRRIRAWSLHHRIDLTDIPFFVSNHPARFLDARGAAEVSQAIDELTILHGDPVLIIIDTLNRNFGPGDESGTEDMTRFIGVIDDTLRCRYHCGILIVHHSGLTEKERARGSSALRASLDWEYRMTRNSDGTRILTCTKSKDHIEPPQLAFEPTVVELDEWIDPEDGEVMTSCVLIRTEATPDAKPLTGARKIAYDALVGLEGPAHIDLWRDAAYSAGITASSEQEAKKKAFQRAVAGLRSGAYVETKDDYWWTK